MGVVQHASNKAVFSSGTSGTLTATFGSSTTAGNCLVACITASNAASTTPSITAVKTGTAAENWAAAKTVNDTTQSGYATIWTDQNTGGGATQVNVTVTFNQTAGASAETSATVDVYEVSGVLTSGAVDATAASANGNSGTAWSSGASGTTSQASEIAFGVTLCVPTSGGTGTLTGPSSPWTNEAALSQAYTGAFGSFTLYGLSGYETLTSAGTVTYSGTASTASYWDTCAVTLKLAAAGTTVNLTTAAVAVAAPTLSPGGIGAALSTAAESVTAPALVPAVAVPLTALGAAVAAPAPAVSGPGAALPALAVTAAAPAVGFNQPVTVALPVLNVAAGMPLLKYSRRLLVSIAAKAGTDDYGNNLPQGIQVLQGIIEGTVFQGADFAVNTAGAFFYSGTPASGNLVGSWAVQAGTDAYGNAYPKGLTIGSPAGSTPQVALVPAASGPGGAAQLQFPLSPASFFTGPPNIAATSPSNNGELIISGPALSQSGFGDWVQLILWSFTGTTPAHLELRYIDANGTAHVYQSLGDSGVTLAAAQAVYGVHPGTGTGQTNPAAPESWQTASLVNGWTGSGGAVNGIRYRMLPLGAGVIEIEGDIINATATGSSTAATMGTGYQPPAARNQPAGWNNPQASNAASAPWVFVDTSGNIQIAGIQVANKGIFFHAFVPMD